MTRIKDSVCRVQIGARFGRWEAIGKPFSVGHKSWMAVCRCQCGTVKPVACNSLASGNSGGCHKCHAKKHKTKYGEHVKGQKPCRLYNIWAGMKQRCTNQNHPAWKDYGGRGIVVCAEWLDSYPAFKAWAVANGYGDDKQIDRYPDNDSGYRPDNCRWVPCKTNQRNRRSNVIIKAFGESKCLAEWIEDERCVVKQATLLNRLTSGWVPEDAITKPCRPHKAYHQRVS